MLKTLGAQIKEFKKDSFLTPVFMILEVLMETVIPLMMASIIDNGVEKGDIHHIYVMGGLMILNPWISLLSVPLIIGIYLLLLGVDCLILAFSKLGTRY